MMHQPVGAINRPKINSDPKPPLLYSGEGWGPPIRPSIGYTTIVPT